MLLITQNPMTKKTTEQYSEMVYNNNIDKVVYQAQTLTSTEADI